LSPALATVSSALASASPLSQKPLTIVQSLHILLNIAHLSTKDRYASMRFFCKETRRLCLISGQDLSKSWTWYLEHGLTDSMIATVLEGMVEYRWTTKIARSMIMLCAQRNSQTANRAANREIKRNQGEVRRGRPKKGAEQARERVYGVKKGRECVEGIVALLDPEDEAQVDGAGMGMRDMAGREVEEELAQIAHENGMGGMRTRRTREEQDDNGISSLGGLLRVGGSGG
jgi:hypothetical protein